MRTYYDILCIQPGCPQEDVKKAFRKLATEHHPDRGGESDKFKEVNEAYQILGDADKRAIYDLNNSIRNGVAPNVSSRNPMDDFVQNIWTQSRDRNADSSPPPIVGRGDDIYVEIEISLEESLNGCQKTARVAGSSLTETCSPCSGTGGAPNAPRVSCGSCAGHGKHVSYGSGMKVRPCGSCHGRGTTSVSPCKTCRGSGKAPFEKNVQVKVPSGLKTDDRLRVSGQGCPGMPPGDLYINVKVRNDPRFRRDHQNLHVDVTVSLDQALLGGWESFPGPDGQLVEVNIPPGTQPNSIIEIPKRGVPAKLSLRHGSLMVHIQVKLPKMLTPRAKKLLEELMSEVGRST